MSIVQSQPTIVLQQSASPADALSTVFADLSPNTMRAYGESLQDFANAIGCSTKEDAARYLFSLDQGQANMLATQYRTHLMNRTPALAASTVKSRLGAIAGIVKRMRRLGIVNWKLDVEAVKATKLRDTRGPGVAAIDSMRESLALADTPLNARNLAILELLFSPALRRAEVARLNFSDVDFEGSRIRVLGKGRDDYEFLTMPTRAQRAIQAWVRHRGDWAGPLFNQLDPVSADRRVGEGRRLSTTSIYNAIGKVSMRASGRRARPHGVRHTAITELLRLTRGDVRSVRNFSRHANVATVLTYDDNRNDEAGRLANLL